MRNVFSDCHPIVNFIFYIGAFVMGMCFLHPAFLCCSFVLALVYYRVVEGKCLKFLMGIGVFFVGISLINPIVNIQGDTILFTYLNGRPYTLEALCYGMAVASMFVTVITWFATYNKVMTSDKFLYCFGKLAPAISLILTMVLRMVPEFQKKSKQISGARKCIGKSVENGTYYEKAEHGMTIISALTSWALEGGIIMSDSMRSRGYGSGKRTAFSIYKLRMRDIGLLIFMIVLIGIVGMCAHFGGMQVSYVPQVEIAGFRYGWTLVGVICYILFLSIPTVMNVMEEVTWRILRSRI